MKYIWVFALAFAILSLVYGVYAVYQSLFRLVKMLMRKTTKAKTKSIHHALDKTSIVKVTPPELSRPSPAGLGEYSQIINFKNTKHKPPANAKTKDVFIR